MLHIYRGDVFALYPLLHITPKQTKESKMDYNKRLKRLDEHLKEHPTDYQASISRLKTYSDAIEHEMYLRKVARLKRLAEFRRMKNEQESI